MTGARFKLGQLVWTQGINELIARDTKFAKFVMGSIGRHAFGDWGDLCEEDKRENEYSLGKYLRLLSSYKSDDGMKIWIITEADRSVTTILLPDEY